MTDTEAMRLLADLKARYCAEEYDPTQDVTQRDITESLGLTESQAETLIKQELAAGRMTKRQVKVGRSRVNVYRRTP